MDKFDYNSLLGNDNYIIVVSLMIVAGVVVIIIGFLGCCGSIKDNRFMLIAVSLLMNVSQLLDNFTEEVYGAHILALRKYQSYTVQY